MKKTSSDRAPHTDRIRSWAISNAYGFTKRPTASNSTPTLPLSNLPASSTLRPESRNASNGIPLRTRSTSRDAEKQPPRNKSPDNQNTGDSTAQASEAEGTGAIMNASDDEKKKPNIVKRFFVVLKKVLLHSWINVFLVFVPVGIALANIPGINPGAVFGVNAVAIIPLAALLSHATESVARKMGDTIGALLNVTFGNADEIRIVQASLLGSILANLLLILGMAFFLGGLRFREQIYNSTVTQMSACLLSLSVISLVLPTAFHASFTSLPEADEESLKVSRGTSIILLLVYVLYLLFQLKSHAYMYESTPQHVIDEESTPGPAAAWLDTSSSESSSSSDSDSDGSGHSRDTVRRRMKRAIRRRRRKSSVASIDEDVASRNRASSFTASPTQEGSRSGDSHNGVGFFPRTNSQGSDVAIDEEDPKFDVKSSRKHRHKKSKRKHRRHRKTSTPLETEPTSTHADGENIVGLMPEDVQDIDPANGEPRRVDFADTITSVGGTVELTATSSDPKRPGNKFRGLSFRPVAKSLAPPVFTHPTHPTEMPVVPIPTGPVPRVRYGIRRTNSLPERLNQVQSQRAPGQLFTVQPPVGAVLRKEEGIEENEEDLSQPAAIVMLLITTALVAVCAEFMVDAIDDVVAESNIKETFIGLIILPIVGNAAEHVTAVAVAMKNKMDLAIGVAIGSSIQIALFLTPLVVILGWITGHEMTLYFTLFETVCLFVSAFIINFLILDGRSNYLEGALLCATYIIIAVVAFYYPEGTHANIEWGGGTT
ncbi:Sodium/calcium exchanger protein-domain-containing protein [Xylariomycetidae sp. FL2044]|nr:Sodium/calcium exchanger protein-domain-containing protein [Xylariomycetidae sp. FL2044]